MFSSGSTLTCNILFFRKFGQNEKKTEKQNRKSKKNLCTHIHTCLDVFYYCLNFWYLPVSVDWKALTYKHTHSTHIQRYTCSGHMASQAKWKHKILTFGDDVIPYFAYIQTITAHSHFHKWHWHLHTHTHTQNAVQRKKKKKKLNSSNNNINITSESKFCTLFKEYKCGHIQCKQKIGTAYNTHAHTQTQSQKAKKQQKSIIGSIRVGKMRKRGVRGLETSGGFFISSLPRNVRRTIVIFLETFKFKVVFVWTGE